MRNLTEQQEFVSIIFERLRNVYNVKRNSDLAAVLSIDSSYCSQSIKRASIPWKLLYDVSESKNVSLDYLVFGHFKVPMESVDLIAAKAIYNLGIYGLIDDSKKSIYLKSLSDTIKANLWGYAVDSIEKEPTIKKALA